MGQVHLHNRSFNKATSAGFLIALGIVYGDIGTSPLYAMQAIVRGQGGLAIFLKALFWGLFLLSFGL